MWEGVSCQTQWELNAYYEVPNYELRILTIGTQFPKSWPLFRSLGSLSPPTEYPLTILKHIWFAAVLILNQWEQVLYLCSPAIECSSPKGRRGWGVCTVCKMLGDCWCEKPYQHVSTEVLWPRYLGRVTGAWGGGVAERNRAFTETRLTFWWVSLPIAKMPAQAQG